MSGGKEGKIRRRRIKDSKEVRTLGPMDAGNAVCGIAVSRDGKWIVSGTGDGRVVVWNSERHSKVTEFRAHGTYGVVSIDISADTTKIVTVSEDFTARVWSLSGERLLGLLEHVDHCWAVAAKFSLDGRLIATATYDSVRVFDSQNGNLLVEFPVQVFSESSQSLAWASDSKQLFVLSHDGYIYHVDVSSGTTLSKWHIHSNDAPTCIVLESNGTFIAAAAGSSVSFWDTTSQEQIGAVIQHTHGIQSMAVSSNYDLVTSGGKRITLRTLCGILPSHYLGNVSVPP